MMAPMNLLSKAKYRTILIYDRHVMCLSLEGVRFLSIGGYCLIRHFI